MANEEQGLERFVAGWLEGVDRLGLGVTRRVETRRVHGRLVVGVTVTPPKGSALGARRWAQVVSALQVLLDAALAGRGYGDGAAELTLVAEGSLSETGEPEGLAKAVRRAAQVAVRLGRGFALGPMSVAERRLVHQALGDMPEVVTRSEGEGIFRRLWVVPRPGVSEEPSLSRASRSDILEGNDRE